MYKNKIEGKMQLCRMKEADETYIDDSDMLILDLIPQHFFNSVHAEQKH